jgi:L-asparaginase/Glu-tRNA(Gln) amidotransferase subunit D
MEQKNAILIIITGGTIDAEAYPDPANPPKVATMLEDTAVPQALAEMNLSQKYYCFVWLRKDSKAFTEEDITALARIIRHSGHQEIIITHGTDRMVENSRALCAQLFDGGLNPHADASPAASRRALLGETQQHKNAFNGKIAFTGSMIPLSNGLHSDGYRNLKFAMEEIANFPSGVWIAFEGKRFDPHRTVKDFNTYQFVEI